MQVHGQGRLPNTSEMSQKAKLIVPTGSSDAEVMRPGAQSRKRLYALAVLHVVGLNFRTAGQA